MKVYYLTFMTIPFLINAQYNPCNDKYCLYYVGDSTSTADQAKSQCSQNGRSGWLLEIYDDGVKQLVDGFISYYNLEKKNIILGSRIIADSSWYWINKTHCSLSIENQQSAGNIMVYVTTTVNNNNNNNNVVLVYHADVPTNNHSALCSVKNVANCTRPNSWSPGSSCYFPLNGTYTWYEAHYECTKVGGSLAVFDELDLKNVNQTWVQFSLKNENFWIGATRTLLLWNKTEIFMNYTNWKPGYPVNLFTDHCIRITSFETNNPLLNYNCGGTQTFSIICMEDNSGLTTSSTTATTTTTTTVYSSLFPLSSNSNHVSTNSGIPTSNSTDPISTTTTTNSTNGGLTDGQRNGLGAGLGVPLFLLLFLAIGLGIYWLRKKEKLCFKPKSTAETSHPLQPQPEQLQEDDSATPQPQHKPQYRQDDLVNYAVPVVKPNSKPVSKPNQQDGQLTYVAIDHSRGTVRNLKVEGIDDGIYANN